MSNDPLFSGQQKFDEMMNPHPSRAQTVVPVKTVAELQAVDAAWSEGEELAQVRELEDQAGRHLTAL